MTMMEEGALYKVNRHITAIVIATALMGIPMLCGFVLEKWSLFRIPSLIMVLCCFYLNNLYPDRLLVSERNLEIKYFLKNDWVVIPYHQLKLRREKEYLVLLREKGAPIRISTRQLSVRLYNQLLEKIKPDE